VGLGRSDCQASKPGSPTYSCGTLVKLLSLLDLGLLSQRMGFSAHLARMKWIICVK
jgi:hypothetical protein